ncbi:MAG: plasmid pRiA4b ORF-3 family protein [Saprospiraceae bacterium]
MYSINRSVLIVRPKQALYDWLKKLAPEAPEMEELPPDHDDADVFLIPDFLLSEQAEEWLKANVSYFSEMLFSQWWEEEEQWPKNRNWETFNKYFSFNIQTQVRDMLDDNIERVPDDFFDDEIAQEMLLDKIKETYSNEDPGIPLQFKITLIGTNPKIWRRIQIGENVSFQQLHFVLQASMGWMNAHLHEFRINDRRIGIIDEDYRDDKVESETEVKLSDLHLQPGDKFHYTYDFGDSWEHLIEVEPVKQAAKELPYVIDGESMGPPEDIGGVPGLQMLMVATSQPNHPQYKELREHFMLDEFVDAEEWENSEMYYDPRDWSVAESNDALKSIHLMRFLEDNGML